MPWRTMKLRGNRVLARCHEDGTLLEEGGRVEVRYKPNDGRAYRAGARNLAPDADTRVLPDDHCGPAEAAPAAATGAAAKAPAKKTGGAKASGGGATSRPPEAPEGDEVLFFADGACSGNPGPCGIGVVMLFDDQRRELSEFLGRGTNNIAELTAIRRAAEAVPDPGRRVRIFTDSSYSIGVLTKGWKAKANQELVAETKAALARLSNVRLFHVRGHAGIPLNERADQLAVVAVEARASSGWVKR